MHAPYPFGPIRASDINAPLLYPPTKFVYPSNTDAYNTPATSAYLGLNTGTNQTGTAQWIGFGLGTLAAYSINSLILMVNATGLATDVVVQVRESSLTGTVVANGIIPQSWVVAQSGSSNGVHVPLFFTTTANTAYFVTIVGTADITNYSGIAYSSANGSQSYSTSPDGVTWTTFSSVGGIWWQLQDLSPTAGQPLYSLVCNDTPTTLPYSVMYFDQNSLGLIYHHCEWYSYPAGLPVNLLTPPMDMMQYANGNFGSNTSGWYSTNATLANHVQYWQSLPLTRIPERMNYQQ